VQFTAAEFVCVASTLTSVFVVRSVVLGFPFG
jgi:hypothetical protein